MAETFKPVQGFPDYEIGDCGTVISLKRGKRNILRDCRKDRYGHRKVNLYRKGEKPKSKPVHQLVAAAFIGPRPEVFDIDHINSDPRDNRAANLRYVTRQ